MSLTIVNDSALMAQLPEDQTERELLIWWLDTAHQDFEATVPKILEYGGTNPTRPGSADLHIIGDNIATLMGWEQAPESVKQEVGVWFYAQGKIARLVADYQNLRPGKADTWFDATVYTMMARRVQAAGRWP